MKQFYLLRNVRSSVYIWYSKFVDDSLAADADCVRDALGKDSKSHAGLFVGSICWPNPLDWLLGIKDNI